METLDLKTISDMLEGKEPDRIYMLERGRACLVAKKIIKESGVKWEGHGRYDVYILSDKTNHGLGEFEGVYIHSLYTCIGHLQAEVFFFRELINIVMEVDGFIEENLSIRVIKAVQC